MSAEEPAPTFLLNRELAYSEVTSIPDPKWQELASLLLGTATAGVLRDQSDCSSIPHPDEAVDLLFMVRVVRELARQEVARDLLT